jgi:hypothetical protein
MYNSLASCTIESLSKNTSTPKIISAKNENLDFENVPLLVNFAKWNKNEN